MLAFGMKTISAKNLNVHFVSWIAYVVVLVISSVYYYLFEISSFNPESFLTILILWFINSALFYGSIVTRVYGLRNIDTTIFFPLYMTFLPIIITLASVLLYKEVLNIYEWIGVWLWISVPLLLITKREFWIQKNLKLWIIFMLATSLLAISSAIFPKELHNMWYSVDLYVIVSAFFWVIFATVAYHLSKDRNSSVKKKIPFKHIWFAIILWCIQYAAFISFNKGSKLKYGYSDYD